MSCIVSKNSTKGKLIYCNDLVILIVDYVILYIKNQYFALCQGGLKRECSLHSCENKMSIIMEGPLVYLINYFKN